LLSRGISRLISGSTRLTGQDYRDFMDRAGLRLLSDERLKWAACLVIGERP